MGAKGKMRNLKALRQDKRDMRQRVSPSEFYLVALAVVRAGSSREARELLCRYESGDLSASELIRILANSAIRPCEAGRPTP